MRPAPVCVRGSRINIGKAAGVRKCRILFLETFNVDQGAPTQGMAKLKQKTTIALYLGLAVACLTFSLAVL